ncbi:uroporphyrin-III C-methyltransferase [Gammaproteobacteria bacterium]|nr:uroporphyrin-III C-methyltransferase [Gammaproteobacteria bacterium]
MSGTSDNAPPPDRGRRYGRLVTLIVAIALAAAAAQWFGRGGREPERGQRDELAKLQRRLGSLEDRVSREREDLGRLATRLGPAGTSQESIAARIDRLDEALAKLPGGDHARNAWLVDQAAYFLRIANAQENLAGNSGSALKALAIADEYLRDAGDPRLLPVRKLIASEQAALRAVPAVDAEGLVLKLDALATQLRQLPQRQAPVEFRPEAARAPAELTGTERALATLRSAFFSVVSVRRTDTPPATAVTAETGDLVARSLGIELQIARLALLRNESRAFRASLAEARRQLLQYYNTDSAGGAAALASLDAIAGTALPDALPDISASLAELTRLRERGSTP